MPLYAYNKKGEIRTIPVINVRVPASPAPPARSEAFNITSEMRNLSVAEYEAINFSVQDGTFDFEWSGTVEYETPGLATSRPSSGAGIPVTDIALRDRNGIPFGTIENPLRTEIGGNVSQPVFARGERDIYLATTRTLTIADGTRDSLSPLLWFQHGPDDGRLYELKHLDVFIQGAGPSIEAGAFELRFGKLEEDPLAIFVPTLHEAVNAIPVHPQTLPSAARLGVPAQDLPGFEHLLFSWPVDAAFTGPLRWSLGEFVAPVTLLPGTTSSYGLTVTILDPLMSTVRMSAALCWRER